MAVDDSDPGDVIRALAAREPIFHRPEFGTRREDFERMMAHDFRETGASGRTYSREVVLDILGRRHSEPVIEQLRVSEFHCQRIAENHYLLTAPRPEVRGF